MSEIIDEVVDASGCCYRLGRLLGEGGQGKVYAVQGGRLAVKIIDLNASDEACEQLRRRLAFVRRLPLDDVPIARPLETLRPPHSGYVMKLLADMEPIMSLIRPVKGVKSIGGWYIAGGGLRRRLRLLARCAEALGQLHGKGLVYGDLSPNNVFVSSSSRNEELWLIDADNLQFESLLGKGSLWTRGYGAPEVVKGRRGVSTLTDAHSLAVLAFETLSLAHPFRGDVVENGEPELEDEALEGKLPWIDHPENGTNRSSRGIPRDIVLSPLLKHMCQRAFVEGLTDPSQRPGVMEWAERLHTAADLTLDCPHCPGNYFYVRRDCPWCGQPRGSYALLRVDLWSPDREVAKALMSIPVAGLTLTLPSQLTLSSRIVRGRQGCYSHEDSIVVRFDGLEERIRIRTLDGGDYRMVADDGIRQEGIDTEFRSFPTTWRLHLGPMHEVHRIISFKTYQGS